MTDFLITLNADTVTSFLAITSHLPYDIDIQTENNNRIIVDGKSLVGILSLDLSKPLIMSAHTTEISDILRINDLFKNFLIKK